MSDIQLRVAIRTLANGGVEWAQQLCAELERMNRDGWKYTVIDAFDGEHDLVFKPMKEKGPPHD